MITWRTRFNDRFTQLKEHGDLTQKKLADELRVTQGTINNWLKGETSPRSIEEYEKLADALGLHPSVLLCGIFPIDDAIAKDARRLQKLTPHRQEILRRLLVELEQSQSTEVVDSPQKPDFFDRRPDSRRPRVRRSPQ